MSPPTPMIWGCCVFQVGSVYASLAKTRLPLKRRERSLSLIHWLGSPLLPRWSKPTLAIWSEGLATGPYQKNNPPTVRLKPAIYRLQIFFISWAILAPEANQKQGIETTRSLQINTKRCGVSPCQVFSVLFGSWNIWTAKGVNWMPRRLSVSSVISSTVKEAARRRLKREIKSLTKIMWVHHP